MGGVALGFTHRLGCLFKCWGLRAGEGEGSAPECVKFLGFSDSLGQKALLYAALLARNSSRRGRGAPTFFFSLARLFSPALPLLSQVVRGTRVGQHLRLPSCRSHRASLDSYNPEKEPNPRVDSGSYSSLLNSKVRLFLGGTGPKKREM